MATNAELVQALKDWKDEILGVTSDYKDAIASLEKVRSDFKSNTLELLRPYVLPLVQLVTVLAVVGFLLYYSTKVECGVTIKFLGTEISRICK